MSRFLISAAHKSSGKTTVSIGLCAALRQRGLSVQPFKKGPDYIDPLWLGLASDQACYNLDFYTQQHSEIDALYGRLGDAADVVLIEGNKGLFDGLDVDGSNSNAALAAQLDVPVILVIDCQGMTRGVAPLVLGYQGFEPKVNITGVILNKVGGPRHESKLRAVLEQYTEVPVIGSVRRDAALDIRERHLGLVPSNEAAAARTQVERMGRLIAEQIDLDQLLRITASKPGKPVKPSPPAALAPELRIGIPRDAAFAFYYPDDIEAMRQHGAEPVFFDAINDPVLPRVDGLFIGGGFPEVQMQALAANQSLRNDIHEAIEHGLPTYAECGGLMYLSRAIEWNGNSADMVGIIPARAVMHPRPVGRGYAQLRTTSDCPWYVGDQIDTLATKSVHEFHHSALDDLPDDQAYGFDVLRGTGIDSHHDGFVYRNLMACYTHQRHTQDNPWVANFIAFIRRCRAAGATTSP